MAEAVARNHFADRVEVASAGIHPLGYITDETITVLKEKGVPTDGLHSKGFEDIDLRSFHLLVNLTHYSLNGILPGTFKGKVINGYVPDPYGRSLNAFRQARDAIERMVSEDLPVWIQESRALMEES